MASHKTLEKVLNHPDKDEIISKLIIDVSEEDIMSWLKAKYEGSEYSKKFVLSDSCLKDFKDKYLDIYSVVKDDILKAKEQSPEEKLQLSLQNNSAYKNKILQIADKKINIEEKITTLISAIEDRAAEVFDRMQGREIDFKKDEILIKYLDLLGSSLEKFYNMKDKEETRKLQAGQTTNNITNTNVTIQVVDQQVSMFYQAFKEILETLDFQTSMRCLEMFNSKMSKIRELNTKELTLDQQVAEVSKLNDNIQKRLNE